MIAEKLKKAVLQHAIEGKLVPQDSNDEPASELLKRIRAEKEKLVKEGTIKKDKNEGYIYRKDGSYYEVVGKKERCIDEEIPFDIPESWEWCRFKSVVNIVSARRVHQKDWRKEGIPFYRAREIVQLAKHDYVDNELFISEELYNKFYTYPISAGDLMITGVGTLGRAYIVKKTDKFYYKDASVLHISNYGNLVSKFLKYYLESETFAHQVKSNSSGTTVATLTISRMAEYLLPIPPLAEQQRIVGKIADLYSYLNPIINDEQVLNELHVQLPDKLKKSILQQAIQGKLVDQDPIDEPASELLKKIQAEKEALIKAKKIKRDKNEGYIYRKEGSFYEVIGKEERCIDEEIPFEIPDSWEWVRLRQIITKDLGGGTPSRSKSNYWNGKIPWMTVKDFAFARNGVITDTLEHITEDGVKESSTNLIDEEAVIICTRVALGKIAKTSSVIAINQDLRAIWLARAVDREFFINYYTTLNVKGTGTTVKGIKREELFDFLVPIPPLAEQQRIVEKIEELLAQVDKIR